MTDKDILERIRSLVEQYHDLEKQHKGVGLSAEQRQRLADLQVEVDRHWDVLRRARAAERVEETAAAIGSLRPAQYRAGGARPGAVRSARGGRR